MYDGLYIRVIMYEAEIRALRKKEEKQLARTEMRMVR
jgi:hypothetical protein